MCNTKQKYLKCSTATIPESFNTTKMLQNLFVSISCKKKKKSLCSTLPWHLGIVPDHFLSAPHLLVPSPSSV